MCIKMTETSWGQSLRLVRGRREVLNVSGYQILWKPEWSNEMSVWPCPGFSHARICFGTHFLSGNLSFETARGLQRTISLMVERQNFASIHEWCKRCIHPLCVNWKLQRKCWIVYLVTVQMLDLGDYCECAQQFPFFSYLQISVLYTHAVDVQCGSSPTVFIKNSRYVPTVWQINFTSGAACKRSKCVSSQEDFYKDIHHSILLNSPSPGDSPNAHQQVNG